MDTKTASEQPVFPAPPVSLSDPRVWVRKYARLNKLCRSAPNPVGFIAADCLGLASFVFVDYGDAFMCHDKAPDGEDQVCCKNG